MSSDITFHYKTSQPQKVLDYKQNVPNTKDKKLWNVQMYKTFQLQKETINRPSFKRLKLQQTVLGRVWPTVRYKEVNPAVQKEFCIYCIVNVRICMKTTRSLLIPYIFRLKHMVPVMAALVDIKTGQLAATYIQPGNEGVFRCEAGNRLFFFAFYIMYSEQKKGGKAPAV